MYIFFIITLVLLGCQLELMLIIQKVCIATQKQQQIRHKQMQSFAAVRTHYLCPETKLAIIYLNRHFVRNRSSNKSSLRSHKKTLILLIHTLAKFSSAQTNLHYKKKKICRLLFDFNFVIDGVEFGTTCYFEADVDVTGAYECFFIET